jgi:hypothetical protein
MLFEPFAGAGLRWSDSTAEKRGLSEELRTVPPARHEDQPRAVGE